MIVNKSSRSFWGWMFVLLAIFALVVFALLVVVLHEIEEEGWAFSNIVESYIPFRTDWRQSVGNEFTGEATAWTFGIASAPVASDLILRSAIRYAPLSETMKVFLRRVNKLQRKYLMPFHTYLSILALGFGVLHLSLSTCVANPFPEWGLILSGVLVATGLLFKWNTLPKAFRKSLYRFHNSLIVSGILLSILLFGHAIMEID